jgi:peptidyl-prolyl cis-trans isomerase C
MMKARVWEEAGVSMRLAGIALMLLVSAGCQKKPEPPRADAAVDVLARVGDREIRSAEFQKLLDARQAASPVPVSAQAALDEWIQKEILLQSARRAGLEQDAEVREVVAMAMIGVLKERQLEPALKAIAVSDDEARAEYDRLKEGFAVPEKARLAVLFLAARKSDATARASARERMQSAVAMTRAETEPRKHGFGALATNFSDDQETRYRGGELGWLERTRYPQRIEQVAIDAGFGLGAPGQVSDVVEGENGFYAVMLLERQPAGTRPFEDVAVVARARVLEKKRADVESTFLAKLRADLNVQVHAERLPATKQFTPAVPALPPTLP